MTDTENQRDIKVLIDRIATQNGILKGVQAAVERWPDEIGKVHDRINGCNQACAARHEDLNKEVGSLRGGQRIIVTLFIGGVVIAIGLALLTRI